MIEFGEDEFTMNMIDPKFVLESLESGELELDVHSDQEKLVLLGSTEELQQAFGSFVAKPGALGEEGTWTRLTEQVIQEDHDAFGATKQYYRAREL